MRTSAVAVLVCVLLALPTAALPAGPEIFLRDEPEAYVLIDKLQGLGLLPGLMTGTRGLEAREVALEAGKEGSYGDPFVDGMLRFLKLEGARDLDFRIGGGLGYSNDGYIPPNAQGVPVPDGAGYRVNGFFRAAPYSWLGLQARAEAVIGSDGERTGRIEETSLRLGWPQATLEAGRFAVWYGPGRHGALLFTTNAEPLIGVRIRNPRPIAFPKPIGFLGAFQYDFFMARIDTGGPYPDSLVSGMRLALRPNRYLELGASRAMHFGGKGRDESFSTFWDILTGQRESAGNTPKGNSLASIDAKVLLPFRIQPVVLYGEWGGEDQSQRFIFTRHAWLGGIFLPSIGPFRKADLRVEYGDNLAKKPCRHLVPAPAIPAPVQRADPGPSHGHGRAGPLRRGPPLPRSLLLPRTELRSDDALLPRPRQGRAETDHGRARRLDHGERPRRGEGRLRSVLERGGRARPRREHQVHRAFGRVPVSIIGHGKRRHEDPERREGDGRTTPPTQYEDR